MAMQDKANVDLIEDLSDKLSKMQTMTSTNDEKHLQSV
jgi:hypothetical protein